MLLPSPGARADANRPAASTADSDPSAAAGRTAEQAAYRYPGAVVRSLLLWVDVHLIHPCLYEPIGSHLPDWLIGLLYKVCCRAALSEID